MLHISEDEQAERFESRRNDPTKHWKYSAKDLETTAQWSQFLEAYEDAIEETSTHERPGSSFRPTTSGTGTGRS